MTARSLVLVIAHLYFIVDVFNGVVVHVLLSNLPIAGGAYERSWGVDDNGVGSGSGRVMRLIGVGS